MLIVPLVVQRSVVEHFFFETGCEGGVAGKMVGGGAGYAVFACDLNVFDSLAVGG